MENKVYLYNESADGAVDECKEITGGWSKVNHTESEVDDGNK